MLIGIDELPAVEKQHLLICKWYIDNSQQLNAEQKTRIETKFQEIIKIFVEKTGEGR